MIDCTAPALAQGCPTAAWYGNMPYLASADFCDPLEEIYSTFKATGAKMVGHWPAEGYQHENSKARGCFSRLGTSLLPNAA